MNKSDRQYNRIRPAYIKKEIKSSGFAFLKISAAGKALILTCIIAGAMPFLEGGKKQLS